MDINISVMSKKHICDKLNIVITVQSQFNNCRESMKFSCVVLLSDKCIGIICCNVKKEKNFIVCGDKRSLKSH